MRKEDDRAGGAVSVAQLVDGGDGNARVRECRHNRSERAHAVDDGKADVIARLELLDGANRRGAGEGLGLGAQVDPAGDAVRELKHVANHGARGGEGARARAVEHGFAHRVAHGEHGVHGSRDAGEHVVGGNHGGVHARVDALGRLAGDAEQLDAVAHLARLLDVGGGNVANALHVHIVGGHAGVEGDGGEDGHLARGIETVDVGRGIGLGVAQALGVGEHIVEVEPLGSHAREDVVGGAVQDTRDGEHAVCHERVLERVHDGDATARGRFAANLHAGLCGKASQVVDAAAQKRLVGGDHVLAGSDGALEDLGRRVIAADELDDDVDFRVGYDVVPVGGEGFGRDAQLCRALRFQGAGHLEAQVDAIGGKVFVVVARDDAGDAAAHGSEPDESYVDGAGGAWHCVSFAFEAAYGLAIWPRGCHRCRARRSWVPAARVFIAKAPRPYLPSILPRNGACMRNTDVTRLMMFQADKNCR